MSSTLLDDITNATSAVVEPLTVEQYHAMIRQGILVEGAPIELIDGILVRKDRRDKGGGIMTVGPRHARVVVKLRRALEALLAGENCHVRTQQPITLNGIQEPEPDISVALGNEDDYPDHHPGPGAITLVVEVADSSLSTDRGRKLTNYAVAGIPHYWIVNLRDDCIEHYMNPQPHLMRYQHDTPCGSGHMATFEFAGRTFELAVDDVLS